MQTANTLIELEKKFWQSMVDDDTDTALSLLDEPSMLVGAQGTMQFDHARYREMAEHGSMGLKSFKLSDMNVVFPTEDTAVVTYKVEQTMAARGQNDKTTQRAMADSSVWVHKDGHWVCAMHTETPLDGAGPMH